MKMKNKIIECDKKDCKHKWLYKGSKKKREGITCPGCQRKLNKLNKVNK